MNTMYKIIQNTTYIYIYIQCVIVYCISYVTYSCFRFADSAEAAHAQAWLRLRGNDATRWNALQNQVMTKLQEKFPCVAICGYSKPAVAIWIHLWSVAVSCNLPHIFANSHKYSHMFQIAAKCCNSSQIVANSCKLLQTQRAANVLRERWFWPAPQPCGKSQWGSTKGGARI